MANDQISVGFGAQIDQLLEGTKAASEAVEESVAQMNASMASLAAKTMAATAEAAEAMKGFESVGGRSGREYGKKSRFDGRGIPAGDVAIEGFRLAKEAIEAPIEATNKWNEEVAGLSHTLGITMKSASDLNASLRIVGISSEQYESMLQRLSMRLRTNEAAMQALGMKTRDASGHLVDGQAAIQNAL